MLDAAAAMENMLIMATKLGYGSLWVGVAPDPKRVACIRKSAPCPNTSPPWDRVGGKTEKVKESIDRTWRTRYSTGSTAKNRLI
jgi:hypothetical protein